ncbi:DUF732 domain-containing protein [Mycobacterium camsae]|uniref:DUF732 domain-containing protein n=1 Tax=Mycobacterium gordonae TaxID=1778 RepID=UPI00197DF015|nr:DUF732 domain-containing protein [Mycobacterium gordonae]
MSGKMSRVLAGVAIAAVASAPTAPTASAEPGPGSGETFFVDYMTRVFVPPTSEAAARAIIPLAQQVCDAKAQGQTDLQAANIVVAGNGVETIGLGTGSVAGDEGTALNVVNAATLAYCPQYNPTIGQPVVPNIPVE